VRTAIATARGRAGVKAGGAASHRVRPGWQASHRFARAGKLTVYADP